MMVRRLLALAATLVLAPAAAAQARPPVLLSTSGSDVGVAVDAQGTAHIAYNGGFVGENGVGEPLMYCAWPRAAKTCTPRAILTDSAAPSAQPPLLQAGPAPGQLTLVSSRDQIDVLRSADNGATWTAPVGVGTGRWFGGSIGPAGQLALSFRNLGYVEFYERSLTGSPADTAEADLNHGHAVDSVTGFAGNIPVLVSGGTTIHIAVSSWSGQGDIHDPATWIGPFNVGKSSDFDLASGPRGLWLAYAVSAAHTFGDRIYARRFRPQTHRFGKRYSIPFGRLGISPLIGLGLGQSSDGRLVVAWFDDIHDRIEVSASRTGTHWTRARVVATGVTLPFRIKVGLGPKGRGVVVWDDNGDDKIKGVKVDAAALLRRG
jgi:hypothetical protein